MSAVTLETLRADFDALQAGFCSDAAGSRPSIEGVKRNGQFLLDEGLCADHQRDLLKRMMMCANAYFIARDHGLQAAMLFKLSDGAIDPRGPA